ncbi:MAG: tetratricopeptide repeat protein [Nitrospira sp.]|nr:tetratricopeptide repeat protein [Nitrospira sp.]
MIRLGAMKYTVLLGIVLLCIGSVACSKGKAKPLVPLALEPDAKPQAVMLTEQGTQAYQARQFDEARSLFSQAVVEAPQSGPAHYNYAVALYALGDTEAAHRQFVEAANLAPGDKIIWDSPVLRPYGNPESKQTVIPQSVPGRRGGGPGR